jgi:hypothetical protein
MLMGVQRLSTAKGGFEKIDVRSVDHDMEFGFRA